MMEHFNRVITIGGSAGGLQAIYKILEALDSELPASVFVVVHSGQRPNPGLETKLSASCSLHTAFAEDGEPVISGRLYLAPSNHHMLIKDNSVRLTQGPHVNRTRPAIDLLFRSAGVAYGPQTIGVVLSGLLYDGAAGLQAVKRCGGITIVQDPKDAPYSELPENAIAQAGADYVEPATDIGPLLNRLVNSPVSTTHKIPSELIIENKMDLNHEDDISKMDQLGSRVPVSCPECGGQLWEISGEGSSRYRCHTGHGMSITSLLAGQDEEIEQTLWVALRTMEEKVRMQEQMVRPEQGSRNMIMKGSLQQRVEETRSYAKRLRRLLLEINKAR